MSRKRAPDSAARASARWSATPEAMAFATMFGLAPHLAELLARLATGQPLNAPRISVARLRRALDPEAIDTTARGYQITEIGVAQCEAAIQDFRAWVTGRAA